MADSVRQKKISQAIFKSVSTIIIREYGGGDLGNVSVSDVRITPDLKTAIIYYTIFLDKSKRKIGVLLEKNAKHIRYLVAKDINHIKFIPELKFVFDEKEKEAIKIEKLIDDLKREDSNAV